MRTPEAIDAGRMRSPFGELKAVDCAKCGYDLRGLSTEGKCPECGFYVVDSINSHLQDLDGGPDPIAKADLNWLCAIRSGLYVAMVVLALFVAFEFLPNELFIWRSHARVYALAIACGIWTLAQFAAWKLLTAEPDGRQVSLTFIGRGALLLCFLFVAPWPLNRDGEGFDPPTFLFSTLIAATGSFVAYWQLARIARRGRWTLIYCLFVILALSTLVHTCGLAARLSRHYPIDSLSRILRAPSALFCDLDSMGYCVRWLGFRVWHPDLVEIVGTGIVILRAFGLTLLFFKLQQVIQRRGREAKGSRRNTAANSRP